MISTARSERPNHLGTHPLFRSRVMLLAGILCFFPRAAKAQLTTGLLEGTVRDTAGRAAAGIQIQVEGPAGFEALIHTDRAGQFVLSLPYGHYELSSGSTRTREGVAVDVAPLQVRSIGLVVDGGGRLGGSIFVSVPAAGLWGDSSRGAAVPGGFSPQSVLLNRGPASVTAPLDFTGLGDNRLALVSGRALSWTGTEFKLQGLDVGDSYQPGRPAIAPDVEAIGELVTRTGSALMGSESYGYEIGSFLAEPGRRWHGEASTWGTGSGLFASNLPPEGERGAVQRPAQFEWFTRDRFEAGGPVTSWADLWASGTGQWSSQTVETAGPGQEQGTRMWWGNARGRIRASARDQLDAEYSGARIALSNWGIPAGIEALVSRRMSPEVNSPDGFANEAEADAFRFLQVGWTHELSGDTGLGTLAVRYGYSDARLDTWPERLTMPGQSRIELLGSAIAGEAPLETLATRPRQEIAAAWQPAPLNTQGFHQQITAGGDWEEALPRNRFMAPSNLNLIIANEVPAYVVVYNTPADSREPVKALSAYVADHAVLPGGWSLDGALAADFSRGSVPGSGSAISWNSVAPRAGFGWRIPHARGFTVRGAYLRWEAPIAARYLDYANPNTLGGSVYQWMDRNGDGWFEPGEQGALLMRFGGQYSSILPSLRRPYADELNVTGEMGLRRLGFANVRLFRRDEKDRLAAIDTGLANAFTPVTIFDPGPDGMFGTFDDQRLTVYEQNPATFGNDHYVLENPPGLRTLEEGVVAEGGLTWKGLTLHVSFTTEKSWGPANPGNAVFENDPGVLGALFVDPNSATLTLARSYMDRAYLGKVEVVYRFPSKWGGWEVANVADYMDGLSFARELLASGLAQGPFLVATTVRGSPGGGNRAQFVLNWNLRVQKAFRPGKGRLRLFADLLNVRNSNQQIQQIDLTGVAFNQRLPVAIQPPRFVRLGLAYSF